MGVNVDEAGCHDPSGGVDLLRALAVDRADPGDQAVLHRDIGAEAVLAAAVHHGAATDNQIIVGHVASLSNQALFVGLIAEKKR